MDVSPTLRDVRAWPVTDRLELVFRIWDQLVEDGWQPEITEELAAELDRRLATHEANPDNLRTREQVLDRIRRK
jgi:putative addiction module component (TIGR02574 family)